ncbi:MAG TPA: SUMF1/EgtB/PvdO family nonheme iron enzyme, partial [Sumerlaeia bacterium]|nr:SUMF1/EgtB/PvdO family nonheme iron enzyme [Sumerlaeia bacterium]
TGLLDRLVDVGGLVHWANIFDHTNARGGLEAVRAAAKQMASDVIRSQEFLSKDLQPADYVVRLYRSFLGRFPSDTEVGVWTGEVAAGRQTYDTLIGLFGDAGEFSQQLDRFFGPLPTPSPTPLVTATPAPTAPPETPTPVVTAGPTATPTAPSEPVITVILGPAVQLRLIRIPAGSFQMGSPDTERSRGADEGPVHTVAIGEDFYMSEYEVTQKQWLAVMSNWPGPQAPSNAYGLGDNYPAYLVSWNDCQDFIINVNSGMETTGQLAPNFRLPTEAEWEYACRAGTETRFFFGDSLAAGDGNTNGPAEELPGNRSDYMWFGANNSPQGSKEAGAKQPNQFSLYDMSGNVAEWCQDVYHSDYNGAPTDGSAWESPTGDYRVVRGGSWDSTAADCRSAARGENTRAPDKSSTGIGFRVVWIP